jgi:hypothetical protein
MAAFQMLGVHPESSMFPLQGSSSPNGTWMKVDSGATLLAFKSRLCCSPTWEFGARASLASSSAKQSKYQDSLPGAEMRTE